MSAILRWLGPHSGHPVLSGAVCGLFIFVGGFAIGWMGALVVSAIWRGV